MADDLTVTDARSCGGVCACRAARPAATGTRLLVRSGNPHTLRVAAATGRALGVEVTVQDGTAAFDGAEPSALLAALTGALTGPERAEARGLFLSDPVTDVEAALRLGMRADPLTLLTSQHRSEALADALARPEVFTSHYQPIVRLGDGATVAHEALLRTRDLDPPLAPGPMFAEAGEAGWVHVLDRIGRERAIEGAAGWLGTDDLFVNFTPSSIYRPEVCLATTERAARRAGVPLTQVVFEVVETEQVRDVGHLQGIVDHFRSLGVRVAVDDVGSGFASLNLVAELAPDVIKIDLELVQRLPDPVPVAVVRTLVTLGHDIGATVLAEGIETEEQRDVAVDLGVDLGQGWLFGRPVAPPVRSAVPADSGA